MQLLKWFSLMKEVVMCNKNLRQKSTQGQETISFFKHRNFAFALFRGGRGGGRGEG